MATPRCFYCPSDGWQRSELCWRQSDFTSLLSRLRALLGLPPWTIMTFPLRKSVSGRQMWSPIVLFSLSPHFLIEFARCYSQSCGNVAKLVCGWELGSCPWSWKPPQPSLLQDYDLLATGLAFISPDSDSLCFISPLTLVWVRAFLFTPLYVTLIDARQVFTWRPLIEGNEGRSRYEAVWPGGCRWHHWLSCNSAVAPAWGREEVWSFIHEWVYLLNAASGCLHRCEQWWTLTLGAISWSFILEKENN